MRFFGSVISLFCFCCFACDTSKHVAHRFVEVGGESGIDFANYLTLTDSLNPYTYRNYYNGGGVAVGDINNDGLLDIYFSGNQVANKLYINKGNLLFEDITKRAGVSCAGVWSTGVTFVDVNSDGYLDIYVCKSGPPGGDNRHNELFINNGDLTFTESSRAWGLDVVGLSVQSVFFDYDRDGDLDCYLLNNSIRPIASFDRSIDERSKVAPNGSGNRFFVNVGGRFTDRSSAVGIYQSAIGFGLGVTLGDFNEDTWIDIFVSNDFFERDYLYINDQKGGFEERLTDYFGSISMGSMGADYADLDNDGHNELFVTEMLPDSLARRKTKTVFESWNRYQEVLEKGYHHQFSRNVLQKKFGDSYFELGRLSGVAATEWSWGALMFDMNNDGLRDIFVANGIAKDLLDRDYLTYDGSYRNIQQLIRQEKNAILALIAKMPSSKFSNYAFLNKGDLQFVNASNDLGLDFPQNSTGSAYADFDNDGDLDLVLNNCDARASLYRNDLDTKNTRNLAIDVFSATANRFAVGTKVSVFQHGHVQVSDNFTVRGFQSSSQSRMHFGLRASIYEIDSIRIFWPDGYGTVLYRDQIGDSYLRVNRDSCVVRNFDEKHLGSEENIHLELINHRFPKHIPNGLNEFDRERLLPFMQGKKGPFLAETDIDNDGHLDLYCGGGRGQAGFFLSYQSGKWSVDSSFLSHYAWSEEMGSVLFDANRDGLEDLYLAAGGRFYPRSSTHLEDHVLINSGRHNFKEQMYSLPAGSKGATSCVSSFDFDRDGDQDIVSAYAGDPFVYGALGSVRFFRNDGDGFFAEVAASVMGDVTFQGVVTDMVVTDFNLDTWPDLVLIGDWMGVHFLQNRKGTFVEDHGQTDLGRLTGWWSDIETEDLNGDLIPDFVIANHGKNTFFRAKDRMYLNDFDDNGSVEQIYCTLERGGYVPIVDRDELVSQIPAIKKKTLYYSDFADMRIDQLFEKSVLERSRVFEISTLESILLISTSRGYSVVGLPKEAQFAPLYALKIVDINQDGVLDLLAGGNNYFVKPQFGRFDASSGWFFKGKLVDGVFSFENGIPLGVKGQIRDIETIQVGGQSFVFFSRYGDSLVGYRVLH